MGMTIRQGGNETNFAARIVVALMLEAEGIYRASHSTTLLM